MTDLILATCALAVALVMCLIWHYWTRQQRPPDDPGTPGNFYDHY